MKKKIRNLIWKILGSDYSEIKRLNDVISISNDNYTKIGFGSYHNGSYVSRSSNCTLKIGKFCSIAKNVWFIMDDNNHQISNVTTSPFIDIFGNKEEITSLLNKTNKKWKGIVVGNDVWIGMNVMIMPNINIGNGVIIAAGSIITKDIPDYAIVGGIPGKTIRYRFDKNKIKQLQKLKWWDWEKDFIKKNYLDFYLPINDFIDKYI